MSTKKIAFITGGNRGIGFQTALDLGKKGYTIVIGVRDASKAETAVVELRKAGIEAEATRWDATDAKSDADVKTYLEKKYGHLNVLINNAGINREEGFAKTTLTVTPEVLRETFETNVFAVIRLTQALVPLIKKSPAGRIVNLSSILGSLGVHSSEGSPIAEAKSLAYNMSKTALNAFTVHLAHSLKDTTIKVNSAHPGWVQTEMGGPNAPVPLSEGSRTSVQLATLEASGPSGAFFHDGNALPW